MPTPATVRYLYPGQASIVAHCEGKDSNACLVTVGGGTGGTFFPLLDQMPVAGRQLLFESNWNGLPPLGTIWTAGQGGIVAGRLNRWSYSGSEFMAVASDAATPRDPPTCCDYIYALGQSAGECPGGMQMAPATLGRQFQRLYLCDVTKIVGSSYQVSSSGMTKHWGYVGIGADTNASILALYHWGSPYATPASPASIDYYSHHSAGTFGYWLAGSSPGNHVTGGGPAVVKPGNWTRTEWLLELNDMGQANGRIRCQFTDLTEGSSPQMVIDTANNWPNLVLRDAVSPGGWVADRHMVPVFGGEGIAKTQEDRTRWGYTYMVGQAQEV